MKKTKQLAQFLSIWFRQGQRPIEPGTLVDDTETFDELVAGFLKEQRKVEKVETVKSR